VTKKKAKAQHSTFDVVVNITPIPLDADAYYVNRQLSEAERVRLHLAWKNMNEMLDRPKPLLFLPNIELEKVPTSVLERLRNEIDGVLAKRAASG